ncbi:hypothetical protein [Methylobacterium gregans]|uniref:hypothetical protein n=1 Tax=Methylobacterium gregans TaxID=374424 RepID=UPI001EE33FF0|nr:hypothetical protein [Methylobacterium gregans]MDQ0520621.1 hypothetical protein [Methylobacterium gregans]GLS53430.1 hypothetical protein GCM10007886_16130 [Methylobacterium gregans]
MDRLLVARLGLTMSEFDRVGMAVLWLKRHREELQTQLDILNGTDNSRPALKVEVIADTAVAREIVQNWIYELDIILSD